MKNQSKPFPLVMKKMVIIFDIKYKTPLQITVLDKNIEIIELLLVIKILKY